VAGAIVASTLTTCVIFLPVVFARTTSGALFQALALVVVFALACSLLVALTLVPMLAARFLRLRKGRSGRSSTGRRFEALEGWYTDRLRFAIQHRPRVFLAIGVLLVVCLLLWPLIPVELAPQTDADELDIQLEMARGTNIAVLRSYVDELEEKVRAVVPASDIHLFTTEIRGDNAAVELKLAPQERRSMPSSKLADLVRREVDGEVPAGELDVEAQQGLWMLNRVFSSGGSGEALELELRGWDLEEADRIAADIRRRMQGLAGIADVNVSRREGRPEQRLILDRERISRLGLTVREVGETLLANVGGVEAGRFREGGNEFPITVRLRPADRLGSDDLDGIALRTASGIIVPLSTLVERERGRAPVEIQRVDGQRVTYVTANLESGVALGDAVQRVQGALSTLSFPDGFSLLYGGQYEEQLAARRDFLVAIAMALVLVYMLLAAQFERFLDPLVVMLSVPMALIGVVPTLLLTGTTLNIQSVMGLVMLIGIVVNNAIVLVDAINLLRRERQLGVAEAVVEGARLRLRPILMTTATTALGLMPLALGLGIGGEIQAALARVVVGGLLASSLVTLVLIPVAYVSMAGLTAQWQTRQARSRHWVVPEEETGEDHPATA
jgi:HAE1 family hydrophobic/amphiphilic exporter-1